MIRRVYKPFGRVYKLKLILYKPIDELIFNQRGSIMLESYIIHLGQSLYTMREIFSLYSILF